MATKFSELEEIIDTNNVGAVTEWLEIPENKVVAFGAIHETGTHTTHVLILQHSLNCTNPKTLGSTLTGLGIVDGIETATKCVRVRCSIAEGVASTSKIFIQAK